MSLQPLAQHVDDKQGYVDNNDQDEDDDEGSSSVGVVRVVDDVSSYEPSIVSAYRQDTLNNNMDDATSYLGVIKEIDGVSDYAPSVRSAIRMDHDLPVSPSSPESEYTMDANDFSTRPRPVSVHLEAVAHV